MKNKFAILAIAASLFSASLAMAQEGEKGENFASNKAKIIASLNKEKAAIDSSIACISSAQKREDADKCRDQRKASMEQLKNDRINEQKAHLQDKLKRLDQEIGSLGQKK